MSFLCEEWSIRSHGYHVAVALTAQKVETFSQCVNELSVFRSVFTEINLGLARARIVVVVMLVVEEVFALLVVVLVEDRHIGLLGNAPCVLIVRVLRM